MKSRLLQQRLKKRIPQKTGRLIVITGARQTGKTTLVKELGNDYEYISIEDPALRDLWASLTAEEWYLRYPKAILDEIQKVPSVIESIKMVYDTHKDARYLLLGSSQILLMDKVRESLAGRVSIFELYPLILPEMRSDGWYDIPSPSILCNLLENKLSWQELMSSKPMLEADYPVKNINWDFYLKWGLMPVMADAELDHNERSDWLKNYALTYLQRDMMDIARINDLNPFVKVQKSAALLTAQTVNLSQIANEAGIAVNTVKKYLSYLEISYQAFMLKPWLGNRRKRLVKSPKLHFLDTGILRTLTNNIGKINGHEFESAVVSEIFKQIKTYGINADLYHLRTSDGREVDLLIELHHGYYAFEIKQSEHVRANHGRHLKDLANILDKPLLGSIILSSDRSPKIIDDKIIALPVSWFLG